MIQKTIYGVDFSGAADAGRKIWIARAVPQDRLLWIVGAAQAQDLPGGGKARAQAYAALRRLVASSGESVFGMDFPFSLPKEAVPYPAWETFALAFGDDYPTADAFYALTHRQAGGREKRRTTDRLAKTPFAPNNRRVYRQTYYGIRDLLAPLVRDGQACVPPLQAPQNGKAWILEICPASILKSERLYCSYKGKTDACLDNRAALVNALARMGVVITELELRERLLADAEGDALDSVLAAFGAWRALRDPAALHPRTADDAFEGRVYF